MSNVVIYYLRGTDVVLGEVENRLKDAHRVWYDIRNIFTSTSVLSYITISLGAAKMIYTHDCSIEGFIRVADNALYKAKSSGGNTVIAWH